MKHGRAVIPFGKYKGVRLRLLPNDYLSWLTTLPLMRDSRWKWLLDSMLAELKYRGMRSELALTVDSVKTVDITPVNTKPRRQIDL